jgi:hypothetical protein
MLARMLSSTAFWLRPSSLMSHPEGRNGKPSSTARLTAACVPPIRARNRSTKRNLRFAFPDEIEDRQAALALFVPKAAAELLEKHRRALRGPEEQNRIDRRNVDAFIEQIAGKQNLDLSSRELS